jgi:aminotransferase
MFQWSAAVDGLPESGIRRMYNLAASMSDVVNLTVGEPDFPTPPHIVEAYVNALRDGKTRYTLDAGLLELREELAACYSSRIPHALTPDDFLVTSGACESVYVAMRSLLEPGDEAVLVEPSFVLYEPITRLCGAEPVIIQTRPENGYVVDEDRIVSAINDRTKAVLLNSPANPTGATIPVSTLRAILEAAERHNAAVIADEVYDRIVYEDGEFASVAELAETMDRVFVVNSFSKTYCMPGVRIGYVFSSTRNISVLRKMHMYTTNVGNTAGQWAAVAALKGDQSFIEEAAKEYRCRRDRLVEMVSEIPELTGYSPSGAFYLLPALPDGTDTDSVLLEMLKATGVACVPGSTFGKSCKHAFRISFSTSLDRIEEGMRRIRPWLAKQSF